MDSERNRLATGAEFCPSSVLYSCSVLWFLFTTAKNCQLANIARVGKERGPHRLLDCRNMFSLKAMCELTVMTVAHSAHGHSWHTKMRVSKHRTLSLTTFYKG